jgi:hypothetical protein
MIKEPELPKPYAIKSLVSWILYTVVLYAIVKRLTDMGIFAWFIGVLMIIILTMKEPRVEKSETYHI